MADNNVTRAPFGHVCPKDDNRPARVPLCLRATEATYVATDPTRVGIRRGFWPYGPNICQDSRNKLVEWALHEGLQIATPSARCIHWLTGEARRCRALQDRFGHDGVIDQMPEMDHPTFWTRDGEPALILAQPYSNPREEWIERMQLAWPVAVETTEWAPWYGYGTLGIFITRGAS